MAPRLFPVPDCLVAKRNVSIIIPIIILSFDHVRFSCYVTRDILILRIILNKFARLSDILQWRLSWMEICKILFESITIFWENNLKKSLLLVVWSDEREIPKQEIKDKSKIKKTRMGKIFNEI